MITLQGITWNHSRGFLPMVATAQRFQETHPDVEIVWKKRSLQEFADFPIQRLAETFDLIVIDHPFVGYASSHPVLLPLDEHLPKEFLEDQRAHSVGPSHPSYTHGEHHWALAIDAATPVSVRRPDLLPEAPRTWDELMALARRGLVAVPALAVDSLMAFYMICISLGEEPFARENRFISEKVGTAALRKFRDLLQLCPPECFKCNPIAICETMTAGDSIAYCPFAYGYSNYSRDGYARRRLEFDDIVDGMRSTLGGTGLAISLRCRHREAALEYAKYVASAECQRTLYTQSGGQPGHRAAWLDAEANRNTHDYFCKTLPVLDRAYLRPRYNGYLHFQDEGGPVVQQFLRDGEDPHATLGQLEKLYEKRHHETA